MARRRDRRHSAERLLRASRSGTSAPPAPPSDRRRRRRVGVWLTFLDFVFLFDPPLLVSGRQQSERSSQVFGFDAVRAPDFESFSSQVLRSLYVLSFSFSLSPPPWARWHSDSAALCRYG